MRDHRERPDLRAGDVEALDVDEVRRHRARHAGDVHGRPAQDIDAGTRQRHRRDHRAVGARVEEQPQRDAVQEGLDDDRRAGAGAELGRDRPDHAAPPVDAHFMRQKE